MLKNFTFLVHCSYPAPQTKYTNITGVYSSEAQATL